METSRLTSKYQATIPVGVRATLGVKAGDRIAWAVDGDRVKVTKVEALDQPWHDAVSATFADEWLSEEDEELFREL